MMLIKEIDEREDSNMNEICPLKWNDIGQIMFVSRELTITFVSCVCFLAEEEKAERENDCMSLCV